MKHALLTAAAALAALTGFAPAAVAQTDPDGAMVAQKEIAAILGRSRSDFQTDMGTFEKVMTFSNEIKGPCESMLWIAVPRLERNNREISGQSTGHPVSWRKVTQVNATNISDSGPGQIGVAIFQGPNNKTVVGVNNEADQGRFIAATQRLRDGCRPHRIQYGPLGAVGTWRQCNWQLKQAPKQPNGDQTWTADIRRFDFNLTLSANGQFIAQGKVVSYMDPIYTGSFTATGSWELVGGNVQLNGTWYLPDGTSYPDFRPQLTAHPTYALGRDGYVNRYSDTQWDGAGCEPA